ncbi:MAG: hypothetical protein DRJ65_00185 [Acidobacteria bacterium]|nr:MAG: hypothetical protein DRJ65_00185 [Acidobacteriota bacterium]
MSPKKNPRGRIAAGVNWNEERQAYYLRFRATVYQDQVDGRLKPARRTIHSRRNINRRSLTPDDWDASLSEARDLRQVVELEMLERAKADRGEVLRPKTFGELADAYEKDAIDRGTRWDKEKSRWKVLVEEFGRHTPAESITPAQVLEWRPDFRARRKLSARSVNAYVTLLKTVFNLAVRSGLVKANPAHHLRPYEEARTDVEWLTHDQLHAIFVAGAELQEQWGAVASREQAQRRLVPIGDLVVALYFTAARTSNVLQMHWDRHVDFGAGVVVWRPEEVKNRRRVVVPMPARLRQMLEGRQKWADGLVFPNPLTGESFKNIRWAWLDTIAKANEALSASEQIPEKFKIYNLRHTRATHLLSATGNFKAVADLLGDTVKMVEDRYAGRDVPGLRQALDLAATGALSEIDCVNGVSKQVGIGLDQGQSEPN